MCGLTGFVGPRNEPALEEMVRRIAHRGPDDNSRYFDASTGVHLGHLRLAVLDVAGGAQPMWNEDQSVGVIFNGEIYNFQDLRHTLEETGVQFRTSHSDTEVLLRGYIQWGPSFVEKLNGMFAFVIYDKNQRQLFLARDRFGEKPLYVTQSRGVFAFASEVQSLLALPSQDGAVDSLSLAKYFAYGFLPRGRSLYSGIRQLPAGCHAIYRIDTGEFKEERYWRFRIASDRSLETADEVELSERFWEIFKAAVGRRLVSDVPLGIFLSGGIDSSSVLAAATEIAGRDRIRTFTIGFHEPTYDESAYARIVAEHFGSVHQDRVLRLEGARELIDVVLPRLGEPLSDPSILPTYMLANYTREHVTVALSGDGGDELFAGYDPFAALKSASLITSFMPRLALEALAKLSRYLPGSDNNMSLDFRIRRALLGVRHPRPYWEPTWMAPAQLEELERLTGKAWKAEEIYSEVAELYQGIGDLSTENQALEYFTSLYLIDDILVKADRATMQCSLEGRAVFLDNEVAAFCASLPFKWKMNGGIRKRLLKTALAKRLPRSIIDRRKKGFGIPTGSWLRSLPSPVADNDAPHIDKVYAEEVYQEHRSGKRDHRLLLWALLSYAKANKAWV